MPEIARRVNIDVSIAGHSVTDHFAPYLLEFSYTDNAHGKADEVQITLHNRDGRFTGEWKPKKGMEVKAAIVCESWEKDGEDIQLPCGSFKIDEIEFSGPPDKVKIKAVSSELNGPLRDTNRTRAWENTSLQKVAAQLARENNLQLMYYGPEHSFERQDQRNESDLAFVNRLAMDRNMNCKTHDGKLILFDADEAEAADATLAIPKKGNIYSPRSYSFKVSSAGTDYKNAKTAYSDPKTGTTHTAEVKSAKTTDSIGSEKTLNIQKRVENAQQAAVLGKSELRKANAKEQTANIEIMGCPRIAAGQMIKLEDFGDFSGNYFVKTATHRLSGGYATSLELTTPSPTSEVEAGNEVNVAAEAAKEEIEERQRIIKWQEIFNQNAGTLNDEPDKEAQAGFEKLLARLPDVLGKDDELLLCLPEIAKEMSRRAAKDKNTIAEIGFDLLARSFIRWFGNSLQDNNVPLYVDWNWLMFSEKAKKAYEKIRANILNEAAQKALVKQLKINGKFKQRDMTFDFINTDPRDWNKKYQHQFVTVEENSQGIFQQPGPFFAALGNYTLYGLAKGRIEHLDDNHYRIHVTDTAAALWDSFDFVGFQLLGWWDCTNKKFGIDPNPDNSSMIFNHDFEYFRMRYGNGGDFLVVTTPHAIENFSEVFYDVCI